MNKELTENLHNLTGNCWAINSCRRCDGLCDVCHEHDEPRGECSTCAHCDRCFDNDEAAEK